MKGVSIGDVYEKRIAADLMRTGEFEYVDMILFYLTDPIHGAFLIPYRKRLQPLDTNRHAQAVNGWVVQSPNISITMSLDKRPHPGRMFLLIDPSLTGRPDTVRASTPLQPDARTYDLMAIEAPRQKNILAHMTKAVKSSHMMLQNKPVLANRRPHA